MTSVSSPTALPDKYSKQVYDVVRSFAHLVAYDGCHKIYIACDAQQADWFRDEYPYICDGSADEMLAAVEEYWAISCGLRFINAVRTVQGDPNLGYETLIPQFIDDEEFEVEDSDE